MPVSFLRRMTSYVSPRGRFLKKKKKMTMVGPDTQHPGDARRQLKPASGGSRSSSWEERLVKSNFEGEDFAVGSWEERELVSRDGQSKMKAEVFLASIDQRSGSAAGESACTVLAAVIADWLQANQGALPTRSEFDSLIRDGSSEWRKLCDDDTCRDRFPDKHLDLDTVIEAGIRPISVVQEKSFVGFFRPDSFEFLQGAMSFDKIWDEISTTNLEDGREHAYIVSWNDHFFVLKVDASACYIIDTLGERLFEGCNQAFILKFDDSTSMSRVPENTAGDQKDGTGKEETKEVAGPMEEGSNPGSGGDDGAVLCSGRECCKEFIKRFLAAIPLRELEAEAKKGALPDVSWHQRLQIELHYSTTSLPSSCPSSRTSVSMFETSD